MRREWQGVLKVLKTGNFVYNDLVAVTAAVYITRKWPSNPLWLLVIGPSGHGKTTTLTQFSEISDIIMVSSVTPAALISGWGGEVIDRSLFAELDGKVLVAKDFGTLLSMGWATAQEVFSLLREAYDGTVSKRFGILLREYTLKFNFIAATTEVAEKFNVLRNQLGERFLEYRFAPQTIPSPPPQISESIRGHIQSWMFDMEQEEPPDLDEETSVWIASLARAVVKLRTEAIHNGGTHEIIVIPKFEGPSRMEGQLRKLYGGLKVVTGDEDLCKLVVAHGARSSVRSAKVGLMRLLLDAEEDDGIKTYDIVEKLKLGYMTIYRTLRDLKAFGLVEGKKGTGKDLFWKLTDGFKEEAAFLFPQD